MNKDSHIKERLFELCDALSINYSAFSLSLGKNREFLRKITGEIGSDAIRQIYRIYPDVNVQWIITGEGDKFLSKQSSNENSTVLKEVNEKLSQEIKRLNEEIKSLNREVGKLEGIIQERKKHNVQTEEAAVCAAASGSDLVI
ncbi:hypothetical protein [Phocaeicola sp.]